MSSTAASTLSPTGTPPCRPRWTPGPPISPPGTTPRMYAWRRANVAALNQAARDLDGRPPAASHGPEVVCPGGLAYRAGDQVVTLAPGPDGTLVTSQRATVEAVDPPPARWSIRTDDGRLVRLAGERSLAPSGSATGMPPPFTARKARPSAGPISSPTAADENWPMWP